MCAQDAKGVKGLVAGDDADPIDAALRRHLSAIEREEVPERLLELARELQRLLRKQRQG